MRLVETKMSDIEIFIGATSEASGSLAGHAVYDAAVTGMSDPERLSPADIQKICYAFVIGHLKAPALPAHAPPYGRTADFARPLA